MTTYRVTLYPAEKTPSQFSFRRIPSQNGCDFGRARDAHEAAEKAAGDGAIFEKVGQDCRYTGPKGTAWVTK